MTIRDIVNKDVYKIENCDSEPIHIPGSIQPHGALLAFNNETGAIAFCSANTEDFLQQTPAQLLTQDIRQLYPSLWEEITLRQHQATADYNHWITAINNIGYECSLYAGEETSILEIEKTETIQEDEATLFTQTRQFISHIERAKNLKDLCQKIAEQTRQLTGYDRVMIYRFDKNYNGEVYAESKREDLEPFLGLHYPHTDIPVQARELYLRNHLRMITDVAYTPVPLLTMDNGEDKTLDLSDASLRSVSPIHIQYLKNMKVGATLTISLIQDNKLWGLIACHHYTPKKLSRKDRQTALMQGHFLSSQIKVRQVAEEYEINVVVEAHLQQLLSKLEAEEEFFQKFEQLSSLLGVANASGCIILHDGHLYEKGLVPPQEKVRELINWISQHIKSVQYCTSHLHQRYPGAAAISPYASGIIYHTLGKPTENCIIWFREEVERTVNWAGNPDEAIKKNKQGNLLTPRSSFSIWRQSVRYHSEEWRISEINAATRFATALQNNFHLLHLRNEDYKLRVLNENLLKANQELSNINWITTHDLKEPLRKIQVFASRIMHQEEENVSDQLKSSVEKIQKSAGRMQHLVDDILNYNLTANKKSLLEPTDLNKVFNEVVSNLQDEIQDTNAIIQAEGLPSLRAIPFQMMQLFTNLIANALKFAKSNTPPLVTVRCRKLKGTEITTVALPANKQYYELSFIDNGIGFDPKHNSRIFDIFYRLHTVEEYNGTGIGLAICKKIADNHQGAIIAQSAEGEGTTFRVYLPE